MKTNVKRTLLTAVLSIPTLSYAHNGSDFVGGLSGFFHDLLHRLELLAGATNVSVLGFTVIAIVTVVFIGFRKYRTERSRK